MTVIDMCTPLTVLPFLYLKIGMEVLGVLVIVPHEVVNRPTYLR